MKVLLVSDFFSPVRGGLEGHVDSLASQLSDMGHEVHVATLTPNARPQSAAVEVHHVAAVSSRLLPHVDDNRPFHPPITDPRARRDFHALLDRIRPDVVHGHSWLSVSVPRRVVAPLVLTAHDYGLVCHKRTLTRPSGQKCGGPSAACIPCGKSQYGTAKAIALSAATPIGRRLLRPDRIIAVSSAVRSALQPAFGQAIDVIPNFYRPVDATIESRPSLPESPFVMYAGDPSSHKGVDVLLDAWPGRQSSAAMLLLAVTRPITRPLPPGVVTTSLGKDEMASAWRGCSVAVVPSIWPDPFPTVVLEAMAAGTPVVASRAGGIPDMFEDGVHGFLVDPGDGPQLMDRVDRLLADTVLRARMGAAAASHVRNFEAGRVVPRIVTVYDEALAGRAR